MKYNADEYKNNYKNFNIGDKVLIKNDIPGKMQPIYKPKIYEVVQQKGSSVFVQRGKSNLMRDTSKLKAVPPTIIDT